ncbi:hypothetical protein T459_29597 [Capsicum annuum]|uniref:Uncharacterized protein n=1 Tax=Capsicum annuum TaxID=4072 RepID=A0A2G2Y624_CAPAN|nr:hypothetical protein T459_29597 [Capsicum annuum]
MRALAQVTCFIHVSVCQPSKLHSTQHDGMWALGFWEYAGFAFAGLALLIGGTTKYRHFRCSGNPTTRFLDRAALLTSNELDNEKQRNRNP